GLAAETVDGNDPDAMAAALARAAARARAGEGPTLLEAMLGRMRGHSEGDDSLKVVPVDELARYRAEDPVPAYARHLEEESVVDRGMLERLEARIAELVELAISRALGAPGPDPATAMRPVFAPERSPVPPQFATQAAPVAAPALVASSAGGKETTYVDAINQGLAE